MYICSSRSLRMRSVFKYLPFFAAMFSLHPSLSGREPDKALSKLPWHLGGVTYRFKDHMLFETFSVDYQLFDDLPTDGHRLFFVPINAYIGYEQFYCGFNNRDLAVTGPRGKLMAICSPGYTISKFGDKSDKSLVAIDDKYRMFSDHEGPICGVSIPDTNCCKSGLYTITLTQKKQSENDPKSIESLVTYTVYNHSSKKSITVGSIIFRGDCKISKNIASFFEVTTSWDKTKECWLQSDDFQYKDTMPKGKIVLGNWRLNGKPIEYISATATYPVLVPQKCKISLLDSQQIGVDKRFDPANSLSYSYDNTVFSRVGKPKDRKVWNEDVTDFTATEKAYYDELFPSSIRTSPDKSPNAKGSDTPLPGSYGKKP